MKKLLIGGVWVVIDNKYFQNYPPPGTKMLKVRKYVCLETEYCKVHALILQICRDNKSKECPNSSFFGTKCIYYEKDCFSGFFGSPVLLYKEFNGNQ